MSRKIHAKRGAPRSSHVWVLEAKWGQEEVHGGRRQSTGPGWKQLSKELWSTDWGDGMERAVDRDIKPLGECRGTVCVQQHMKDGITRSLLVDCT